MGGVVVKESGNGRYISGIGVENETNFYWRITALFGFSYYMNCKYSKFEE